MMPQAEHYTPAMRLPATRASCCGLRPSRAQVVPSARALTTRKTQSPPSTRTGQSAATGAAPGRPSGVIRSLFSPNSSLPNSEENISWRAAARRDVGDTRAVAMETPEVLVTVEAAGDPPCPSLACLAHNLVGCTEQEQSTLRL